MKSAKLLFSLLFTALFFGAVSVADHHEDEDKGGMHKMSMVHVMITHEVADGDHWLAAWSGDNSRLNQFKKHGVKNAHVMKDPENPNKKGLILAVADMDKFLAFLSSDEGQAAAAEDGVDMDTLAMLVEHK